MAKSKSNKGKDKIFSNFRKFYILFYHGNKEGEFINDEDAPDLLHKVQSDLVEKKVKYILFPQSVLFINNPSYTPDGQYIAYTILSHAPGLYRVTREPLSRESYHDVYTTIREYLDFVQKGKSKDKDLEGMIVANSSLPIEKAIRKLAPGAEIYAEYVSRVPDSPSHAEAWKKGTAGNRRRARRISRRIIRR